MKFLSIFSIFVAGVSLHGMEVPQSSTGFESHFEAQRAKISTALHNALESKLASQPNKESLSNFIQFSFFNEQYTESYTESMDALFQASEELVKKDDVAVLQKHPLFKHFNALTTNKIMKAKIKSGPDIQDFTTLLLGKHELQLSKAHLTGTVSMKLFNNAETFLRCIEIFKNAYFKHCGQAIDCELSYSLQHTSLDDFCERLIADNPELKSKKSDLFEQLVNLISVFEIDNNIINLELLVTMKVHNKDESYAARSFKPILLNLSSGQENISNNISLGQQDLNKQIQNLSGSEVAMPYIKDGDGRVQFNALQSLCNRKNLSIVEIGGGRGETNAVFDALKKAGLSINVLNAEPHEPFAQEYINAYKAIGADHVKVIQKTAQELTAKEVISHFGKKVDAIFASHSFYFILGDLHKATQAYLQGDLQALDEHPLTKYFEMLNDNGVLVVTLQSGAGARLFRNALLGNHGLDQLNNAADKTVPLLRSFGNMAAFLRHFDYFVKLYEQKTGKNVKTKMHYAVANVPLDGLKIEKDGATQGYKLHNPHGLDTDASWLGFKMMDFYGNWKELQTLANLSFDETEAMSSSDLKNLGIQKLDKDIFAEKHDIAVKMQETFLHILRAFAPGHVAMQHPNITLEITVA